MEKKIVLKKKKIDLNRSLSSSLASTTPSSNVISNSNSFTKKSEDCNGDGRIVVQPQNLKLIGNLFPIDLLPKKSIKVIAELEKKEYQNGTMTIKQNEEFLTDFVEDMQDENASKKASLYSAASSWVFPLFNCFTSDSPPNFIKSEHTKLENYFKQSLLSIYLLFKSRKCKIFYLMKKSLVVIFIETLITSYVIINDSNNSLVDLLMKRNIKLEKINCQSENNVLEKENAESKNNPEVYDWLNKLGIDENSISIGEDTAEHIAQTMVSNGTYISENIHSIFNFLLNWKEIFSIENSSLQIPMIQADKPFKFSSLYCPKIQISSLSNTSSFNELKYLQTKKPCLVSIEGPLTANSNFKLKQTLCKNSNTNEAIFVERNIFNFKIDEKLAKKINLTDSLNKTNKINYNSTNFYHKYLYKSNEFFEI